MEKAPLRLLSPWDQLPVVAVIALVFMYMATKGEAPSLDILREVPVGRYMSPENLWHEAIIIGGFTWGILLMISASLHYFAKEEARGILSILEPVRGMIPAGLMGLFFGLMASLSKGTFWIYVGIGLLGLCTVVGLVIALRKLPHLQPQNERKLPHLQPQNESSANPCMPSGKWVLGFFFVSKDDPRILVPRQRGGGLALNLAHRRAWGVLITGMILPIGMVILASFGGLK